MKLVVVLEQLSETVVGGIVHISGSLNAHLATGTVHLEWHSNELALLLNKATLTVSINGWTSLLGGVSVVEKITLHGQNSLFLGSLDLSKRFVNIVLDPAKILLGWVTNRENVAVISHNIVFKVLK